MRLLYSPSPRRFCSLGSGNWADGGHKWREITAKLSITPEQRKRILKARQELLE